MAYKIVASNCTGCSACEPACPNNAIREKSGLFFVKSEKCTECVGYFDEPQCAEACPVDETCVIDESLPRYVAA